MRPSPKKDYGLFHWIAPLYGLFYNIQKKNYKKHFSLLQKEQPVSCYKTIIDIGCGTGALCSVLNQQGFLVTGVDASKKMLDIGAGKLENQNIRFLQGNILDGLPFADKNFDLSVASYVAHILRAKERKIMYAEMSRVSRHWVFLYDYNNNRTLKTDIIEHLEGGDYFNFIQKAPTELKEHFRDFRRLDVDNQTAWYICAPY